MGANARTLSGLAGLGDLILTATGDLSRNRSVGIKLGQGHTLGAILSEMTMVAEGVKTCRAAHQLGLRRHADRPIINQIHSICTGKRSACGDHGADGAPSYQRVAARLLQVEPAIEADDGFPVMDFAFADHAGQFILFKPPRFDALVFHRLLLAFFGQSRARKMVIFSST